VVGNPADAAVYLVARLFCNGLSHSPGKVMSENDLKGIETIAVIALKVIWLSLRTRNVIR